MKDPETVENIPLKAPKGFSVDDVPDEILTEIGRLIAWWGYLQMQLGVIIRQATGLKRDTGRVVTIGRDIQVSALCNMIGALVGSNHWIKDDVLRQDLLKLRNAINNSVEHRNDFAHGVLGSDDEQSGVFVRHLLKTPTQKIVPETEEITTASVKALVTEARNLWCRAQDITQRLKKRPPVIDAKHHGR